MKLEESFDGKEWSRSLLKTDLEIGDFIDFLARRGRKYYRIDDGEPKEAEDREYTSMKLSLGICARCKSISMVADLLGKQTCVNCAYHPEAEKKEEAKEDEWERYIDG